MATVLPGPSRARPGTFSPEGSRGSPHRPHSAGRAGQPCCPDLHHRLPLGPTAQPSERKREVAQPVRPCDPTDCRPQAPPPVGFSRQEGCTGLPSLQRRLSTVSSHLRVPLSADRACLPTSIGDMQESRRSRRASPSTGQRVAGPDITGFQKRLLTAAPVY